MKCIRCGYELNLVDSAQKENVFKCNNCGYTATIKKKQSTIGILGFVFSFLCCLSIVGLILCIIDVCSNGKKNRIGLSIAGIVISSVMLIFSFFVGASAFGNSNKQEKPKTESFEEFKNSCEEFDYSKVAREPSKYKGKRYCFKAKVFQKERYHSANAGYYYKVYLEDEDGYFWGNMVFVMDERDKDSNDFVNVLEDDIVMIYGTFDGMTETTSIFLTSGEEVQINMYYVELIEKEKYEE